MCNRYSATRSLQELLEHFQAWDEIENYGPPRYNVAPTQNVAVVTQTGNKRKIERMKWEFIPHWSSDGSIRSFNARAEKITTTPSFSDAVSSRRCLIPADAFYEWETRGSVKQPWRFEVDAGKLFAFAGVWDKWGGEKRCAIITVPASSLVGEMHDRMPVILDPSGYESWLTTQNLQTALDMLNIFDGSRMRKNPVSRELNNVANEGPELARTIRLQVPKQTSLFG